ncbi:MAG: response regulator [Alphaproteobacteria bacterium]|nr:MAG: response regulator [Alphaproteobacteria bacterium]
MSNPAYHSATVLLFDPEPAMRQNTRSGLLNFGFGEVVATTEPGEFFDKAASGEFDLILAETIAPGGNTLKVIRDIRQHAVGKNPFVNVILSLWKATPEIVGEVINSGADDVISRPMSRNQIFLRIGRLVEARKPFIVTADYIGPDRRQLGRGVGGAPAMIVPNSLRAKVENRPEYEATPEAVALAMAVINNRKISIYTEQILRLAAAVQLLSGNDGAPGDWRRAAALLAGMNRQLMQRVQGTELGHVTSLCEGLENLIRTFERSNGATRDQDKELLEQIPLAIHKACMEAQKSAALAFDIRNISAQIGRAEEQIGPGSDPFLSKRRKMG